MNFVIPAKADGFVIPAKAGIQGSRRSRASARNSRKRWIPAFAGMTGLSRWLLAAAVVGLVGCAQVPRITPAAGEQAWSGRLALTVEGQPQNSLSAGFSLRGAPAAGELTLLNPLGGTLAVLTWSPGSATLKSGNEVRQFASLEELAAKATGAPIPIAALFDWLAGKATPVPGWQVDVSQLGEGRLRAQRSEPPPLADLRVALER